MISATALLVATVITIWHQRSELTHNNKQLMASTQSQATEIQRLETLLTPFRTIALEKFTGSESTVLQKLAERITNIDASLENTMLELGRVKTAASYPKLRKVINIQPDGQEVIRTGVMVTCNPSAISDALQVAFAAIRDGNTTLATKQLKDIVSAEPNWPYAYFYLGCITKNQSEFKIAATIFTQLHEVDIIEPEPLLFEALTSAFLIDYDKTRTLLKELKNSKRPLANVSYIALPHNAPADILIECNRIATELKLE